MNMPRKGGACSRSMGSLEILTFHFYTMYVIVSYIVKPKPKPWLARSSKTGPWSVFGTNWVFELNRTWLGLGLGLGGSGSKGLGPGLENNPFIVHCLPFL